MYKLIDWINIHKLSWKKISYTPNAINLLEKNQDKIDLFWLSENPSIFELDYDALKERCAIYKQELLKNALHPSRIQKYLEDGITIGDLDDYI